MYSLTDLRDIVKDHEETFNPNPGGKDPRKGPFVKFTDPTLVYTQFEEEDLLFETTKLKSPITSKCILKFMQDNRKWLYQPDGEDISFAKKGDNKNPCFMEKKLVDLGSKFDSEFLEYDDEFAEGTLATTQLVYAVVVNRYVNLYTTLSNDNLNEPIIVSFIYTINRIPDTLL